MDRSLALLVALISVVLLLKAFGAALGPPRPIAKRFLTKREAAMLDVLERALPHCRIHAQVAMGALLKAPANPMRKYRHCDRNAFSQKIVDFVAQERESGAILALIEVDDSSHIPARDRTRDAMTAHAGYRTIRIPGSARPTFQEVLPIVSVLRGPSPAPYRSEVA